MAICLGLTPPAKFSRQRCQTRLPNTYIYIATCLMTSSETKTIRSLRKGCAEQNEGNEAAREEATNIRFEAIMCFLRGTCYPKQNDFDPPHSWRRQVGVVLRVDLLSNRAVRAVVPR